MISAEEYSAIDKGDIIKLTVTLSSRYGVRQYVKVIRPSMQGQIGTIHIGSMFANGEVAPKGSWLIKGPEWVEKVVHKKCQSQPKSRPI